MTFFRGLCPGLIEAICACHRPNRRGMRSFSGVYAPASLKPRRLEGAPGHPRRGFSGVYAPASLKPARPLQERIGARGFFRGLCPGLIEAACGRAAWPTPTSRVFPGFMPRPH